MARTVLLATALYALRTLAQSASPYTDEKTGITFNGYQDATGYRFGIALPTEPTTDFIAQIQAPVTDGGGWAGFSMGQSMVRNPLIVAWPHKGKIVSSVRQATGYTNPPVKTGDITMSPIPNGTFVNGTAFSYAFLCSKCISKDASKGLVLVNGSDVNIMGWAFSKHALTDPSTPSAALNYHNDGFGAFGMTMGNAKSASFAKWAALAIPGDSTSPGNGGSTAPGSGNSTTPISGGNSTAIIANATYNHIVVGGGPAGIIAAERLAESGASVLLIERGGPSLAASGNTKTVDWNSSVTMYDVPGYVYYQADVGTPAYCSDTADMAGCLLGGGSSVNAMMYVKPQRRDFDDRWPAGWKWSDVSAAADRVWERNPGETLGSKDGKRYNDEAFDVLSKFFKAQGWAETDFLKDPNSKSDVFGHPPILSANGERSGAVKTYLPLAQKLPNFKLMMNTKVIRAVRTGSSVSGVEVESADGKRIVYNVKEGGNVILAAGSMSTPRILFNSGIGPAEQLQIVASGTSGATLPAKADWIDLPVGVEIKDHPIFTVMFNTTTPMHAELKTAFTKPNQTTIDLFAKGSGILAQSGQRLNWWSSVDTAGGEEMFFQGTCNGPSANTIQMKIYITHGSQSVGSLGIGEDGSTKLLQNPHLTADCDKEAATIMMDRLIKMTSCTNSTLKLIPPSGVTNVTGADLIKSFKSGSHYVGTAKMGKKGERGVVVDTDTKVYGTSNLFVVDASIHPDLPTGNTQAIVMVVAEAAAARILALGKTPGNGTTPTLPGASSPVAMPSTSLSKIIPVASATSTAKPIVPSASHIQSTALAKSSSPVSIPIASSMPSAPAQPPVPSNPTPTPPSSPPKPSTPTSGTAAAYAQCGGIGYGGPTQCAQGYTCEKQNEYYSQCVQAGHSRRAAVAPLKLRPSKRTGRVPMAPDVVDDVVVARRASYLNSYNA